MGCSMSRTARIHNECLDEISLKIVKSPGGGVTKEIRIPSGGFKDFPFDLVDNFYNKGCQKSIQIFHSGKKCGSVEIYEVRDYKTLKLVMDDNEIVTVLKQEGNLFSRLGVSWKVKDAFGKMKKSITVTKSDKKRKRGIYRKISGSSFG